MSKMKWVWFGVLGVFYVALLLMGYTFFQNKQEITLLHETDQVEAEFEGNDWVNWEEREAGIFAESVHPLLSYKAIEQVNDIKVGDRLKEVDGEPIRKVEVVDNITRSALPNRTFVFEVERPNNIQIMQEKRPYVVNGFRLAFSFNDNGGYWTVSLWVIAGSAFLAIIIFAILLPLVRGNLFGKASLIGVVTIAILFYLLQFGRLLYLLLREDFTKFSTVLHTEKLFILGYAILLFLYVICYFLFKSEGKNILFSVPSLILGAFLIYHFYDIIYVRNQLKFYHDLLEQYCYIFFFVHLVAGVFLHVLATWEQKTLRQVGAAIIIAFISSIMLGYYIFNPGFVFPNNEDMLAAYQLILVFPLVNATFFQLQFGKVRLVVTTTFQYIIFFVFTISLYVLISQLSGYVLTNNSFRKELEFLTLLGAIIFMRWVYISNRNKFSKYFTTSQREKDANIKSFIAQIPRYTSSHSLRKDLVEQLNDYFEAETVHLWWKSDMPMVSEGAEKRYNEKQERIYQQLTANHTVWSKNKEIAPFRLEEELENLVLRSAYTLVSPITVSEESYALLMLGKKKRGVYNLADLEIISQLVQQTQLTLNIIMLNTREKELIQAKYEADLMALRSQINPHFLFNTLNSLTELVHESPERAEDAIEKLSYIFRYTTKESNKNLVPFGKEFKLVTTYLDLEKIRFGERLTVHTQIEPGTEEVEIPAFVLQTLIENCIKHGISKILHPGHVSIKSYREDNHLVCEVEDNGPGIDLDRIYKSTGLSNTIRRFENLYQTKNLLYFENTGNGTLVRFKVPIVLVPNLSRDR